MDRLTRDSLKPNDPKNKSSRQRKPKQTTTKANVRQVALQPGYVKDALNIIPDTLLIANIKPRDEALKALVEKVRDYVDQHSHIGEVTEDMSMGELKDLISSLPFDVQTEVINEYMSIRLNKISRMTKVLDFYKSHFHVAMSITFVGIFLLWMLLHVAFPDRIPSPQIILDLFNTFMDSRDQDLIIP